MAGMVTFIRIAVGRGVFIRLGHQVCQGSRLGAQELVLEVGAVAATLDEVLDGLQELRSSVYCMR